MNQMMKRAVTMLVGLMTACGAESTPEPQDLVDHTSWTRLDASDDPFDDRPEDDSCLPGGAGFEDGVFEIQTDACAYLSTAQPLMLDLTAGDEIDILVWHLALVAPEPATAHIAMRIGDIEVLDLRPSIPSPEQVFRLTWRVPEDIAAGTQVVLHAHNHGSNSYRIGPVRRAN